MSIDIQTQYDKLYRYCYHKLGHREAAEDVTQETFLRFYRNYPGRERTLALLYTIARNLCADHYRRPLESSLPEELPQPSPEQTLLETTALRQALEKLSEEEREILLLRYVNEVPLGELARLYGISRFAIYRRCGRLLAGLKQELEEIP